MNALKLLDASTAALYERFDLDADSTPPEKRRKFLMEEVGELVVASALLEVPICFGGEAPPVEDWDVANEAADVIVTVLGLCQSHGITLAEIEAACERVAAKNDAKTPETHALVNGKISRKEQAS